MDTQPTIFDRFGGVRPMAAHLNEAPSTVQSWKDVGRIPAGKQPDVLEKAVQLGLDVTAEDVVYPLGRPLASDEGEADSLRPFASTSSRTGSPQGEPDPEEASATSIPASSTGRAPIETAAQA